MSCDDEPAGGDGFMVGSASTLFRTDKPIPAPTREFPPGFHGAAPGPSHDESEPPRRTRKASR